MSVRHCFAMLVLAVGSWSCTPTVAVAPPEGPIELNINVKIEHEIDRRASVASISTTAQQLLRVVLPGQSRFV